MNDSPFEMRFDPRTVKHLGLRMYATLPPALAEILSNSYDADASKVRVELKEVDGEPIEIHITDNGEGLNLDSINDKFLVIGRNRREEDGDEASPKYGRKRVGKKGLGKLALFGLAKTITIETRNAEKRNVFVLDWDDLTQSEGVYRPKALVVDEPTSEANGTSIVLTNLKRKSSFDAAGLADNLARIFIVDETFEINIVDPQGKEIIIDNERRYSTLNVEFEWDLDSTPLSDIESEFSGELSGRILTALTPIAPASGLRGITLFSRGKLVNAPEFFSASTSSHFYQYVSGWISVDFIDDLEEDVISTNRKSLDWDHPVMAELRIYLADIVSHVNTDWRKKRKEKKDDEIEQASGVDTQTWMDTLPPDVRDSTEKIIDSLTKDESVETAAPIIQELVKLVPQYPLLHWRHLHPKVRDRVYSYYTNQQYGEAASQGVQIYCEIIRDLTGMVEDGNPLVNKAFGSSSNNYATRPPLQITDLSTESERNIQEGQSHMSRGVITGFRNPISHAPIDSTVPSVFTELDCLNVLSLVSYLVTRLDDAVVNSPSP